MVPPVKSTPKLRPLVNKKVTYSKNVRIETTADILLYFIKGISFFTLKISIILVVIHFKNLSDRQFFNMTSIAINIINNCPGNPY